MRKTEPYAKEFVISLVGNAFIRVGFDLKNQKVIDFRVQLEFHDKNEIKVIRRYDMAHGMPHIDN